MSKEEIRKIVIQCANKTEEEIKKEIEYHEKDGYRLISNPTIIENKIVQIYMAKVICHDSDLDRTK